MEIRTTRFGRLHVAADDILQFPGGIPGLEECREWALLADVECPILGWLQCTTRPDTALPVVSPRGLLPHYQVRVYRSELEPLALDRMDDAVVLVVVGRDDHSATLNLKAPLVINLHRRLGRQVINNADEPISAPLPTLAAPLRKSA